LDDAPLTRAHWRIWFLSAMGVFLDAFDLFIMGVSLPLIEQDFGPSAWQLGLVAAASPLGAILGALVAGRLTDLIGRKLIYAIDLAMFVVFAALSSLAWDVTSLIAMRFLLGVGIGADYPISSTYVSEFMPARVRGRMIVGAFSFQAIGSLSGAAVGLIILLVYPEDNAWRLMLASGIIPALLVLFFRRDSPESARWCQAHGRTAEAAAVASQISGQQLTEAAPAEPQLPYSALFSRRFLRRTLLAVIPWFLMDISLYGVGLFTPTILRALNFADKDPTEAVSFITRDIRSVEGAVALDVFLVLGFVLAIWTIERWGRLTLQMLGFMGMTAGLLLVGMGASLPGSHEENIPLIFLGFALFNVMVNWGPNPTTFTLPVELFPTSLRATAHGLAAAAGKVGAAAGIFLLPVLKDAWGLGPLMFAVAGTSFVGFLITWLLGSGLETSGRSLDETEEQPVVAGDPVVAVA